MPKQTRKSKPKASKSKSKDIVKMKSESSQSAQVPAKRKRATKKKPIQQQPQVHEPLPYSLNLTAGIYTAVLHQTYQIKDSHPLYKSISDLYQLFIQKENKRNRKIHTHIPISYFPTFEFALRDQKPSHDKCSICQFEYNEVEDYQDELVNESDQDIISLKCSHLLHKGCFYNLKGDKDWIRCPVCSTIFGEMIGDQPAGQMVVNVTPFMHCDGYEDVGTITINYNMQGGKRGNINYPPTHRSAYLPDNLAGREVLELLKKAFDRKLIFTIGRSVTTGHDNRIVWNGIHHKTNTSGGSAYFGYPDPTYFDRVKLELAAKGVV